MHINCLHNVQNNYPFHSLGLFLFLHKKILFLLEHGRSSIDIPLNLREGNPAFLDQEFFSEQQQYVLYDA